jgi:aryl-alcohol dehydrogenase-like predicted oxidoreductase
MVMLLNASKEDPAFRGISGRPEYVRQSCEASLKRLGIDVIDLYYIHRMDATIPIEDTMGVMPDLAVLSEAYRLQSSI